ncbi:hypothetical protein IKE83_00785, partial [Candidatus Saccharibacteria bacterium]|nr:hypothetical protein [Candidatus Saccharibacteria bacterium]
KSLVTAIFGAITLGISTLSPVSTFADTQSFTMTPMKQKIVLTPGETYTSSINISNPGTNTTDTKYTISVKPFYVDENYNSVYDQPTGANQIVDWITIDSPISGTISPNDSADILFTINVPEDAPAGGQYAAIVATSTPVESSSNMTILESQAIAHNLFAEISGQTIKSGEVVSTSVPGFVFNGDFKVSSSIKNTGNTHGTANYTLKITPAFSDNIVFSNYDSPETRIILPDRTLTNEISWPDAPSIGLFNVTYTIDYEGSVTEISKLVIFCPIWLLFIIIFVIVLIIAWVIFKIKNHPRRAMR